MKFRSISSTYASKFVHLPKKEMTKPHYRRVEFFYKILKQGNWGPHSKERAPFGTEEGWEQNGLTKVVKTLCVAYNPSSDWNEILRIIGESNNDARGWFSSLLFYIVQINATLLCTYMDDILRSGISEFRKQWTRLKITLKNRSRLRQF